MTTKTRYGSLSARLIVYILLIIFVPSFIGLAYLGIKTRDDFRQQATQHLESELEIKSISAANRLDLSKASLRLTTTRIQKDLEASLSLALSLSLGKAPKEWYEDKLYRKLYNILKSELLKQSGMTEARIINSSGNELIRLVQTPSGIEEKASGELENKAHRNYFKNTMALPGGGIHTHPITLQKEYKKIVRPLMPMFRMGGKITLSDEVNFGVVLFNLKSEYIFGMRTSQPNSGFVITDENGYYLVHPDEKALWGNELGTSANLFKDEPDFREVPALRDALLNMDSGIQRSLHHDDYHAWQKIHYDESAPSHYWLFFQRESEGTIEASWGQIVRVGFAGVAIFMLIGFGVLALIVTRTLRPLTEVADAMKRLEDGDLSARADVKSRTEIGRITHAFNSMADWLEKYRSELQKSLAISSAMSDTAPNAHIVIKQDGKIVSANKATERIFGYSIDELIGKDIKTLMPRPYNEREEDYVWDELDMGIERVVGFGMKELNAMRNGGEIFRVSLYLGSATIGREAVFIAVIGDINERKHSEAALLENEKKYRSLFENANDAIYLIDPVTAKIIDCNQKASSMVGYGIGELKEMTMLDLHTKKERGLIPQQFQKILDDKDSGANIVDLHHKRKDGRLIPIEINASTIEIAGKRFNLSVVRDITDRKRAEENLLATSALLEKTFVSLNEAVLVVDPGTRVILSCNPATERIFGYSAEEVVGRNTEFLHVDRPMYEEFGKKLFPALKVHGVFTTDYKFRRKDGTIFLTNHTVTEIKDESGNRTALVSVIRDVTEQKRAENELKASETKYRTLMDNASDAIGVSDIDGTILEVNGQMEKLTGYIKQELIGRKFPTLLPKSVAGKAFKSFKNVLTKGSGSLFEGALIRKDGVEVPIEVTSSTVEYEGRQAMQSSIRDITARKQAEKKIVESRQLLTKTLDSLLEAVFIIDAETVVIKDCNQAASEIFGYSRKEIIGHTTAFLHVDKRALEEFRKHLYPAIEEKGALNSLEFKMKRKNGEIFPTEHSVVPLEDEKGNLAGWVSVVRDITTRKQAEEVITNIAKGVSAETGDEFFRSLVWYLAKNLDAAYAFIGELAGENRDSINTIAVYANEEIQNNFTYELAGTPCINVVGKAICIYPDKVQEQFPTDHLLVEMGVESYIGTPLFDSSGNALGLLVVMDRKPLQNRSMAESMLRIFSIRASAELERKRAEEGLKESESNLEKAQEIAHLGHWKINPETGKVEGSDQLFKIFGVSRNEATRDAFTAVVHPNDREYDLGTIQKSIETGEPYNIEFRLLLKDGTVKWVQAIGEPILDETGKTTLLLGTIQDITERKQSEEALIEAKQVAEKANDAKTRFVAKANHELRNPLTSMISMLKLIVSDMCESREQEKEFIKNVYNSSIHMRGLIEHLLDLAVIESGKMKMNMRSVRFDDLLELVRQITWIRAKEKGLELTFACNCTEENRMIYCDPDRLRELLVNLVNNAIKFTEKGSVSVACMVTDGGEMRNLEIIDTGIGIEPDKLQEVFNPFVQAEGHKYGGAGLGLTLAKKIILAMGGAISIESKGLGHGTKVTLSLPQAPVDKKKKKKVGS